MKAVPIGQRVVNTRSAKKFDSGNQHSNGAIAKNEMLNTASAFVKAVNSSGNLKSNTKPSSETVCVCTCVRVCAFQDLSVREWSTEGYRGDECARAHAPIHIVLQCTKLREGDHDFNLGAHFLEKRLQAPNHRTLVRSVQFGLNMRLGSGLGLISAILHHRFRRIAH